MDCSPPGSFFQRDSPVKNTGVGCCFLLQGIFPIQGSNQGLPHWRQTLYRLSHQGSPRILEWVVYPFFRGSSRPRNWTGISCISGRFFSSWTTREAHDSISSVQSLSCFFIFATPWTVAYQAPLSMGILQAKILKWVAMLSSRGSSQPRDQTHISCISCIAGKFFTHWPTWEA